ncbi:hypothetical protein ABZ876_20535 [Streptomyces sp. NPDC046931]|uniref:hypothetical protein n=1 Tax=Streptomyces sp. NPDC046931 TaxID=3154806 RepID=UPI0033E07B13
MSGPSIVGSSSAKTRSTAARVRVPLDGIRCVTEPHFWNSATFAESDLLRYGTRFVPPQPDEPHVLYNGDPASVLKALDEDSTPRP